MIETLNQELKITGAVTPMEELRDEISVKIDDAASIEKLKKIFQYNYLEFLEFLRCLRREVELSLPKPAPIYLFEGCLQDVSTVPIISLPAILIEYVPEGIPIFKRYKRDLKKVTAMILKFLKSKTFKTNVTQIITAFDKVESFCELLDALKNRKTSSMAQELYDAADQKLYGIFADKWKMVLNSSDLEAAKSQMTLILAMCKSKEVAEPRQLLEILLKRFSSIKITFS